MITTAATKENIELLTQTQVKERGWTLGLIKKLLGTSDATSPNPFYKKAAPVQLYAVSRVEAVEATAEFQQALAKVAVRSQAAKRAAEVRQEARREAMAPIIERQDAVGTAIGQSFDIIVEQLPPEKLRSLALAGLSADKQSDQGQIDRAIVNYIRHQLTRYDALLYYLSREAEELKGTAVGAIAFRTVRRRIFEEIAKVYPEYAEECKRQMEARDL